MRILLVTPPFTQLNTPYPATAYLTGYLKTLGHDVHQCDLSIEVVLRIFCRKGLERVFRVAEQFQGEMGENSERVLTLQREYLRTIDPVIAFLQNRDMTLAHRIVARSFLPEAGRFEGLEDLEAFFGDNGIQDHARHLATLYLEDIGDLITEVVDPGFGFSRYQERLGRTATHFQPIEEALLQSNSLVSDLVWELMSEKMARWNPEVVGLTVPFPGNLFAALKCGQYVRLHHADCKVVLGGGYANTELRRLSDPALFDFVDYVSLDDGEAPLSHLLMHLEGKRPQSELKRTFLRQDGKVRYINGAKEKDVPQREVGTPDYSALPLSDYLSVIELANPMHRLWSDGRWNKLTLAHGCYWGKCSFCDVGLDYIQRYEPVSAAMLCDRIEEMIAQTGQRGFHFVDEAAPPALMRDLAIEILRRGLVITWWTNIRFEKSFTADLCRLLHASGCIAVSGGLEVASDRLLEKMKKGVTVAQVARVASAFTEAGIMVHAYLMYGFPTQTAQETIDSLEMVRQLFEAGVVQSGYWHQFAMTAHSPVGLDPSAFGVMEIGPEFGGFADNDRHHDDPQGGDHEAFSQGLHKSLFNYMRGAGLDLPLRKWFDFRVPAPTVSPDFIGESIATESDAPRPNAFLVWLGNAPVLRSDADTPDAVELELRGLKDDVLLEFSRPFGEWLAALLGSAVPGAAQISLAETIAGFDASGFADYEDWEAFWESEIGECLWDLGLLVI